MKIDLLKFASILALFVLIQAPYAKALKAVTTQSIPVKVEICLNSTQSTVKTCLTQPQRPKTHESCYKIAKQLASSRAKEKVNEFCFYEISEFRTLPSCVSSATRFLVGENRDAALFDCVRQFSDNLTTKQCNSVAYRMLFVEKRNYLLNHCQTL